MSLPSPRADEVLTRLVTALAALIAIAVSLALPAAYFLSIRAVEHAAVAAESKIAAATVSQLASSNPQLWVFENARIRGLLAMLGPSPVPERRIVTSSKGDVVAESGSELSPPVMAV